jgi:hypothetical protein
MGAGIAASPHFPELQMISREGRSFFTRRIEPLSGSCDPMSSRSGYLSLHCCAVRPPVETFAVHCCSASSLSRSPNRSSTAAGRSGKWVRLGLAPLPRASSSLAPLPSSANSDLATFLASAVTAILNSRRFQLAVRAAKWKPLPLCRVAQADSEPLAKNDVGRAVDGLWISLTTAVRRQAGCETTG